MLHAALDEAPIGAGAGPVPPPLARHLYTVLATVAQQFQGCIFRQSESQVRGARAHKRAASGRTTHVVAQRRLGRHVTRALTSSPCVGCRSPSRAQGAYLSAFSSTLDAVRFCHAAQTLLLLTPAPTSEGAADFLGPTETVADGRPIFKGPRVAMAVHQSADYSTGGWAGGRVGERLLLPAGALGRAALLASPHLACLTSRPPRLAAVPIARAQAAAEELGVDFVGPAEELVQLLR